MEPTKILLIDDQDDLRETLALRLHAAGFLIETAGNGKEALERIRLHAPDLIVSDVQMPEMDGFTLLKELKRVSREVSSGAGSIPVIMLTGHKKGPEMRALFEMEGVDAFLEKPVEGKKLLETIKELLSKKKSPAKP